MSLINKINEQKSPSINVGDFSIKENNELRKEEIELLLILIKQSNFRGDQLEILYNTVIKLQNQYLAK